jgi:AbrB family looped-hinge helix DNA binding protein
MNAHRPIGHVIDVNMTSKGQVLIPKAVRDRVGLVPGRPVSVGINDRGEAVIVPAGQAETAEQRSARIRSAIASVRGTIDTGFPSTDDYMQFVRPHRMERE